MHNAQSLENTQSVADLKEVVRKEIETAKRTAILTPISPWRARKRFERAQWKHLEECCLEINKELITDSSRVEIPSYNRSSWYNQTPWLRDQIIKVYSERGWDVSWEKRADHELFLVIKFPEPKPEIKSVGPYR